MFIQPTPNLLIPSSLRSQKMDETSQPAHQNLQGQRNRKKQSRETLRLYQQETKRLCKGHFRFFVRNSM